MKLLQLPVREGEIHTFLKSICTGWSHNGKLWVGKGVLGRSSGICVRLCVHQSNFKRELSK